MSERLHILVADDEPGMRMGVDRALRDFSVRVNDVNEEVRFEVVQAASGEEALERIAERTPDILLLDHKMTGITGLEVLERILAQQLDVLTIMITAYATLETAIGATKRGAYDFLAKPFTPQELKAAVRKAAVHVVLTRQARRLAQEKRQVRFQFISVLAHELKAPLAAIQGYLQILKDGSAGNNPTVIGHMIDRSLVRVDGMRKLILDLLDMTRIESGTRKRELVDLDLVDVARSAIETVSPDAAARKITVELHAGAGVPIHADRVEMEIILNNLVSNAVKYNRDGGRVDVTVETAGDAVRVTVADTGIGLSQADADRLFQDFVRVKNDQTRNILGSGLGLSIVKKLATLYGGEASVRSKAGVGSTFTVTLRPDGGAAAEAAGGAKAAIAAGETAPAGGAPAEAV